MIKNLIKIINSKMLSHQSIITLQKDLENYNDKDWKTFKSSFYLPNISNQKTYYKNIIHQNELYELVLIKWDKDAETIIHPHPKNGCLLKLLEGKLKEERYINNKIYQTHELKLDSVGYMHDSLGTHKITALEDSFSLHLYSPPNFYSKKDT